MRKLKFVFQIIIAFIVALAAYSGLYQPNAESVRAAVKNNLPQSMAAKAGHRHSAGQTAYQRAGCGAGGCDFAAGRQA